MGERGLLKQSMIFNLRALLHSNTTIFDHCIMVESNRPKLFSHCLSYHLVSFHVKNSIQFYMKVVFCLGYVDDAFL